ncbi:MAG: UDP-glucose 4-epimerase GalE [Micrococcales bacterium]
MSVLVTGGLGYIGSHVARLLTSSGEKVIVVDNLSTGQLHRLGSATLLELDLAAADAVEKLKQTMVDNQVDRVIHFAARKQVGESVEKPEWYFQQNVGGLVNLLTAMRELEIRQLVFSSSAATYGMPDVESVSEDLACNPINPYGQTKLVGEWLVHDAATAWGLRASNLRYFNVAGAGWPDLADTAVLNLIPIVFGAIQNGKKPIVFGADYPTADGTCIRDYVHVLDLAEAHLAALEYISKADPQYTVFNVGTGMGSSVFEVLDGIKKVSGIDFEIEVAPRRAGDPPKLTADVSRIQKVLGWKAQQSLQDIIESAWLAASHK